ncbi:WYL domain-containing protein [Aliarcobacter butzleri]|uniref:DnaA ATPase domain-containing protein n=1 Tax=Aliarcobacter butzleri TaxID=28197 RepID=UPI0021B38EEA|nr:WYL domain-containing protein [Aliarcobacter butzleri]UWY61398.1 WYL domain-containing protein [Aliarcobacter butzleri]UXC30707.1 WYL domain-containing protein [Aliarcobacter butzleri]
MKEELDKKCYIDKVYSFENFITNESNIEIFELLKNYPNVNMKYNPIVIEGNFGGGKTHLLNAFKNEYSDKYNIKIVDCFDFAYDLTNNLANKTMDTFFKERAIKQKVEIKFDYENYNYHVKPLKLAFFDGFWYLLALHIGKKDIFKKYHLKTIKNVQALEVNFEIPQIVEDRLRYANSVWFNLDEQFVVRLFIDKSIRKYFERKPLRGQTIIGEDKDGSIEIEIKLTHEMEIMPLILYYIPYIKVLEPQWLADDVKERVQEYLKEIL